MKAAARFVPDELGFVPDEIAEEPYAFDAVPRFQAVAEEPEEDKAPEDEDPRHRVGADVVSIGSDRSRETRGRRHRVVRKRSISARYGIRELRLWQSNYQPSDEPRPRHRSDCEGGERPCPFVSCKWNLYLDVTRTGSITLNFPDLEPDEMAHSCALDVADAGPHTLEDVGELMNVTRERVRQIEIVALKRLHESARTMRLRREDV